AGPADHAQQRRGRAARLPRRPPRPRRLHRRHHRRPGSARLAPRKRPQERSTRTGAELMSTDFQQAKEAVRRLHAYTLNAESAADVATRMQADADSPFHSFDAI